MIEFFLGALTATIFSVYKARKKDAHHVETLKSIYHGFGAPDENGHVGWYRDNRNGSPFKETGTGEIL